MYALFGSSLSRRYHPERILVGPRLHRQVAVEHGQMWWLGRAADTLARCVIAEQDHLGAFERHYPIGLRPTPVIADAQAHDAAEGPPDTEAQIADLEVALLQVLVR